MLLEIEPEEAEVENRPTVHENRATPLGILSDNKVLLRYRLNTEAIVYL